MDEKDRCEDWDGWEEATKYYPIVLSTDLLDVGGATDAAALQQVYAHLGRDGGCKLVSDRPLVLFVGKLEQKIDLADQGIRYVFLDDPVSCYDSQGGG